MDKVKRQGSFRKQLSFFNEDMLGNEHHGTIQICWQLIACK